MFRHLLLSAIAVLVGTGSASGAISTGDTPQAGRQSFSKWRVYDAGMKFANVFGRTIEIRRDGKSPIEDPTLSDVAKADATIASNIVAKDALDAILNSVSTNHESCTGLLSLKLPWVRMLSAEVVPQQRDVRAYCKVLAVIDKEINFEVDMPSAADWNSKFLMGGSGGFLGNLENNIRPAALHRGYATAVTDTGHLMPADGGASWAYHEPERVANFGHRGTHLAAANAKLIIQAYYEKAIRTSYLYGASGSGRSAMMEAQRYPEDFEGVVAACPAFGWTKGLAISTAWTQQAMYLTAKDEYAFKPVVPPEKIRLFDDAVYAKCDAIDGLRDGVITNPLACKFDPMVDLKICKAGDDKPECFTKEQAQVIAKIHQGPSNSQGQIWPGWVYGGESISGQWTAKPGGTAYVIGAPDAHSAPGSDSKYSSRHYLLSNETLRWLVYDNPEYDLHSFNFETDMPALLPAAAQIDSDNPDLTAFRQHHSKLIIGVGWSDWAVNPLAAKNYYDRVAQKMGGTGRVADFARLFLLPGVGHCYSADPSRKTTNTIDYLSALEQWVEHGIAPDKIIASHIAGDSSGMVASTPVSMPITGAVDRTRPICAYPTVAVYKGSGSIDDAGNFVCHSSQ